MVRRVDRSIYAVLARNGVLLHPSYTRACYCRDHYFKPPHCIKKFRTVDEAEDAAMDHLWEIAPLDRAIPERLDVDKLYYVMQFPKNH